MQTPPRMLDDSSSKSFIIWRAIIYTAISLVALVTGLIITVNAVYIYGTIVVCAGIGTCLLILSILCFVHIVHLLYL